MTKSNRAYWTSWIEFALSCIGCMVGLGNIWRFPYICFKNGGGAFLIPYIIFMVLMAMPLMYMEFAMAQYSNMGTVKIWNCCPLFKGLGYGMFFMDLMVCTYYSVIISWTLFYFGNSFAPTLPWASCKNSWNTDPCGNMLISDANMTSSNITNTTNMYNETVTLYGQSSSTQFWEKRVLGLTDSINDFGSMQWYIVLCSLGVWLVTFLTQIKGIKSSGKFMVVASILPYILLLVLLIRGLLLPGAVDGIKYFFIPRWKDLLKFSVWSDAASQAIFSASLGVGEMLTLSSHNRWKNKCQNDAILLPICDVLTSIFAGCVIFATLGYSAHMSNRSIEAVAKSGPGIAFIAYPDALSVLPLPQLWSVLFFLLLFLVGVNSLVVAIQVLTVAVFDFFPHLAANKRTLVSFVFCLMGFFSTLLYSTGGGMYVLQLVDWYLASIPRVFNLALEGIVFLYFYGVANITANMKEMVGQEPAKFWVVLWKFVTPPLMTVMWILMIIQHAPVEYGKVPYPKWAQAVGLVLAIIPIALVFIGFIPQLKNKQGSLLERIKMSLKPNSVWKECIESKIELENMKEEVSIHC